MSSRKSLGVGRAGAAAACALLVGATAAIAEPQVQAPQPTVPQVFTLMGQYVRVAYNNRGYATLGYRVAQQSIGEEWMLLEVGFTVRSGTPNYTLKRENLSLKTPDGTVIPLASQEEYSKANLRHLDMRERVVRDPINYFPIDATRACPLQFFASLDQRGPRLSFDELELSTDRACVGRLFFHIPGGIKVGQHWLLVNFGPDAEVQVPFRILTKDEAKQLEKSWEDIKDAHDAQYKKKK
jgi:hypothetical protein